MTMSKTARNIGILLPLLIPIVFFPSLAAAQVAFRNPLNTLLNPVFSAFVDDDGSATNGSWKDYKCGTLSYDGHTGTDFRAVVGTSVYAAAAGRITSAFSGCADIGSLQDTCGSGYGNHYRIDHAGDTTDGNGLLTIYAHMKSSSITTAAGTPVACSQQLGVSASSGKAAGPHLHFEVRTDGATAATKIDAFKGSCSPSPGYWTALDTSGVPTAQCDLRPLAPSNVSVSSPSASTLQVNFRDNALNETAVLLERKIGTSGAWSQIVTFNALSGAGTWYFIDTGLAGNQTYCYRMRTQSNSVYSASYSNEACGTTLNSAPLSPSNVSINNATVSSLRVNFTDNAANETATLLERKTGTGGAYSQIASFSALAGTGIYYWDNTGLSSNTTYCYRLRAQNSVGYSGYSNEACGTTSSSSGVPLAPSNLSISSPSSSSLQLNFKDNATNETDIWIQRKVGTTGTYSTLGSFGVLSGAQSWYWNNTGLGSKTTYCYRLYASNSFGSSAFSNEACGTTL